MNQIIDFWIIFILKLLLIIGFISGIKFWIKSKDVRSSIPMTIYWIFGLFFVFALSIHIIEAILFAIFLKSANASVDRNFLSSIGSLFGLVFYIYVGVKYLKK